MKNKIQNIIAILYFLLTLYLIFFVGVRDEELVYMIPFITSFFLLSCLHENNWNKLFGIGFFINFNLIVFDIKFPSDFFYVNNIYFWVFIIFYTLPIYFGILGTQENSIEEVEDFNNKEYKRRKKEKKIIIKLSQKISNKQAKKIYNLIAKNER